jgi:hypothetical protein
MKDQSKQLLVRIKPFTALGKRYLNFIMITIFLLIYMLMVLRIDSFSSVTPTDAEVTSKQQTIAQPRIDQNVLSKIQQLQNRNIHIQALFNQARNNPFSE